MTDTSSPDQPVFTLSTWQKRALALLIDISPVLAVMFFVRLVESVLDTGLFEFTAWVATLGYWAWQLYRQGEVGQTIGKQLVGIRVVKEADAQVLGAGLSIGRGVLHVIDAFPCCLPIGYLNPLWDDKRQTFSDKILKTVVIDD